jgi:hypothetical protein
MTLTLAVYVWVATVHHAKPRSFEKHETSSARKPRTMDDDMMNDEDDNDNDQDRSSAQHAASAGVASSTTTVIPIHCDYNNADDDDLPRWTLIEVNGELLPPKEMTLSSPTSTTTTSLECELGCIWLDQDDAGKIVRFPFFLSCVTLSSFFAHLLSLSSPSLQQHYRYRC